MKKFLLAGVAAAMVWSPPVALANNHMIKPDCWEENSNGQVIRHCDVNHASPPAQEPPLTVPPAPDTAAPPLYDYAYPPSPPIGWVYQPYTSCADPQCSAVIVNVAADGLNVRAAPDGYPIMSLVNGVPLVVLQRQGAWLLVGAGCDLTPTFVWSWTAGVPLNRCWVYF
jgi:hypothetical protein